MNKQQTQEKKYHDISCKVGEAFREAYNKSNDTTQIMELLEQYKEARRKIEKPANGSRYGANLAHQSTQN
jgi:uncharacterized protein YaaW (UPF0174 family)